VKARGLIGVAMAVVVLGFAGGAYLWNAERPDNATAAGAPATAAATMREFSTAVTAIGAVKPQIVDSVLGELAGGAHLTQKLLDEARVPQRARIDVVDERAVHPTAWKQCLHQLGVQLEPVGDQPQFGRLAGAVGGPQNDQPHRCL
jgi:hypothetical protein